VTRVSELVRMSTIDILVVSALLCSADVVAAISIVKYEEQPRLFSIVFGQGVLNEAVAIILFNTTSGFTSKPDGKEKQFTWETPFEIIGSFLTLGIVSILIGLIFGILSSFVHKWVRDVAHSSIIETSLLFSFGYISYGFSELFHMSGIISLLTTAILMAQYTWYNLSPQGKHVSSVAFQVMGYLSEAMLFSYVGLSVFTYKDDFWSYQFILIEFFIVTVARFVGTYLPFYMMGICKHKFTLTFKQVTFVAYAGLIRGAISVGLVLKLEDYQIHYFEVIRTTTLTMVVATTIIYGGTLPLVSRLLLGKKTEEDAEEAQPKEGEKVAGRHSLNDSGVKPHDVKSVYEEFKHPNLLSNSETTNLLAQSKQTGEKKQAKPVKCRMLFKRLDEFVLKPLLIHRYEYETYNKKEEFFENFINNGNHWENLYVNDKTDNGEA